MSYYDTSYPPSLYGLPSSHDLQLVGIPVPGTLEVNFTWDSDGKSATLAFGDGSNVTNTNGSANHVYANHAVYLTTVVSGNARDSAQLDLTAAEDESDTEDEPETFTAIKVDEDELPVEESE